MNSGWRVELGLVLLVAAMFVATLVVWPSAPARIPVHWDVAGSVDRYGGRFEGLLGLPLIALALYLGMRYLPRIDPGRANYARFGTPYAMLRGSVLVMLAGLHAVILLWVLRWPVDASVAIPVLVGALCMVCGGLLGKIRPNWFVGIRTPWTLSSKAAWVRTHRLGGWLFIALGALFVLSGAFRVRAFGYVVLVAVVTVCLVLLVYSYAVWRTDPEKQPPAGTQPADDD